MVATATKKSVVGKVDPSKVKKGDLMLFTHWVEVREIEKKVVDPFTRKVEHHLGVTDVDNDDNFWVRGDTLVEEAKSADQYHSTKYVTKTEIVDLLINAHKTPFTVRFQKKNGEMRNLRGRLIGLDKRNQGYVDVEDLDMEFDENRFRQVDCRTIESLIVDDVKYVVK